MPRLLWTACILALPFLPALGNSVAAEPSGLDRKLRTENAARKLTTAGPVDDLGFLRRVTVDLIGRIPSEPEARRYLAEPPAERRARAIDRLMKDERFTARWTVFFDDLFRLRAGVAGGSEAQAFVRKALAEAMPYDEMCRQLIAGSGKPDMTPEAGFVLSDDADPMVLAGVTAQVFLGMRIACAQCHNHPFDVWKREQFYGLAAYFGKTRKVQREKPRMIYTTEVEDTTVLWPPEEKAQGKPRRPVTPAFPFALEAEDGRHIARYQKVRADRLVAQKSKGKKSDGGVEDLLESADSTLARRTGDGPDELVDEARQDARQLKVKDNRFRASALRGRLAELVTSPRNRAFSRSLVNRVWAELLGHGFVNPVDDFRQDNPPSHPQTLDFLADEFVAAGFDFRALVKMVVTSEAYGRGRLPADTPAATRAEAEKTFVAAPVRRMLSETIYDSVVLAGHLFDVKYRAGENERTVQDLVRMAVPLAPEELKAKPKKARTTFQGMTGPRMAAMPAEPRGYDLEMAIERPGDPAKKKGELDLEMRKMTREEIEAERMTNQQEERPVKYVEKTVTSTFDDNPRFVSSLQMASPAPPVHFLRIFGQPAREALGDHRDHSPSMRQALMMLNGKLTHEASRVGTLEPIYPLLTGPTKDVDAAVRLAYREILTREPTSSELGEAKELLGGAASALDGMADLRWVLFNCHEFRFIP